MPRVTFTRELPRLGRTAAATQTMTQPELDQLQTRDGVQIQSIEPTAEELRDDVLEELIRETAASGRITETKRDELLEKIGRRESAKE